MTRVRPLLLLIVSIACVLATACRESDPAPREVRDVFSGVAGSWLDLSGDGGSRIHADRDPARVDLYRLIGPAAVVDLSRRSGSDLAAQVTDLQVWEARHGTLPERVIVVVRTGGGGPVPGIAPSAARWLVEERSVGAVAFDGGFEGLDEVDRAGYHILITSGVPVLEEVTGSDQLPEWGAFVVALAAGGAGDIEGADGAEESAGWTRAVRVISFLPLSAQAP